MDYPAGFRAPEISTFKQDYLAGITRVQMDSGRNRQRRRFSHSPMLFEMSVRLKGQDLNDWVSWWLANAYDWFNMPIQTFLSAENGVNCSVIEARCISELDLVELNSFGWFDVSFSMESKPDTIENNPAPVIIAATAPKATRKPRNRKPRRQPAGKKRKASQGAKKRG